VGISRYYAKGNVNKPIHLSDLQCTGNESDIYQCIRNEEPTDCTHENDVSVECLRKYVLYCELYLKYCKLACTFLKLYMYCCD